MKRSLAAALGLLAVAAALPAEAADLPRGMPYKAPAAYAPAYNWTGFYLGIQGGGAWGSSDWDGLAVSNSPSGGMIGGTAGYNWQAMGSPWVFGLEGDIAWANIKDTVTCGGFACETKNNWFGTARGRVGYPGIAGCLTSPAVWPSATSTPTAPASRDRATPMSAGPSAWASKASSPAAGPPSSNISMRTSATRPAARHRAARRPTSTSA